MPSDHSSSEALAARFAFLLQPNRFERHTCKSGSGWAEVYYYSPNVALRVTSQRELVGDSSTDLCFLIAPQNPHRWCMFQDAVEHSLQQPAPGITSAAELAAYVERFIDPLLAAFRVGASSPLQDFSHYHRS